MCSNNNNYNGTKRLFISRTEKKLANTKYLTRGRINPEPDKIP